MAAKSPPLWLSIFGLSSVLVIILSFLIIFHLLPHRFIPNSTNQFCGGIAGKPCPDGFTCQYDGDYPDSGGTCIKLSDLTPDVHHCIISGCSNEICQSFSEQSRVSTCLYKSEYACLKYAKCETQSSGKCAWTYTDQYRSCLRTGPQL